jgi:transposase
MERLFRLSDAQWQRVKPLLPRRKSQRGRPAAPHRPIVEAMLWILRTGAPWRDLPSAYGSWKTVYSRFARWSAAGALAQLFEALARERDAEGFIIDATIVRAHQDAAGAAKKGGRKRSGARAEVRLRSSTPWLTRSATRFDSPYRRDRHTR